MFIAFTAGAKKRTSRLGRKLPKPGLLRAVGVDDSLNALRQLQGRMITDRTTNPVMGTDPGSGRQIPLRYDLDVDIKRNVVLAIVERAVTQDLIAAFRQRYGEDVVVEPGRLAQPYACVSRSSCTPFLRGGLETSTTATAAGCTTAFDVTYNSVSGPADGILSASHCGDPVDNGTPDPDFLGNRYHAQTLYGHVVNEQAAGTVDAELHSVLDASGFFAFPPRVYVRPSQKELPVYRVGTYDGLPVGRTICKSGVKTGHTCGEVLSKDFSFDGYVSNATKFVKTDYCGDKGDSGGAVYTAYRKPDPPKIRLVAQGIVSGGFSCRFQDYYSIFSHIEFIQDELQVNVLKFPDSP